MRNKIKYTRNASETAQGSQHPSEACNRWQHTEFPINVRKTTKNKTNFIQWYDVLNVENIYPQKKKKK